MIFLEWFKRSINPQVAKRSSVKTSVLYKKRWFEPKNILNPGGSDSKESACNVGDPCLIPGLGRSPGEGNGNLLQYSCLENPRDVGVWWVSVHGSQKVRHNLTMKQQHQPSGSFSAESKLWIKKIVWQVSLLQRNFQYAQVHCWFPRRKWAVIVFPILSVHRS